jgi:hypothetical protein
MDLERELHALDVEWPATPAFVLELGARRRRRLLAAAIAATVAAVAAAFAVPASRGAILRFFDIGSVHVRVVDTLPPAQAVPLTAGLGEATSLDETRRSFPQLLLPPVAPPPQLYIGAGGFVSTVFEYRGHAVLLSELPSGFYVKKLAAETTRIESVRVRGVPGLWLSGGQHIFFIHRSSRLAGNVLLWAANDATYRVEGPALRKADAIALADSLRRG